MTNRTIRVQGVGEATTDPDRVVLGFEVTAFHKDYGQSIEILNKRTEDLRKDLGSENIGVQDIRTTRFNISPQYETQKNARRDRRVLVGYMPSHHLRIELPTDRKNLNKLLEAVSKSTSEPVVNISFSTSDTQGFRLRAIEAAVKEARRNAEHIAAAADLKLIEILSIEYGWSEMRIYDYEADFAPRMMAKNMINAPDIEPEELSTSESVTVTWRVE